MRIYQVIIVMLVFGCAPKTQMVKSRGYVAIDRVQLICDTATIDSLKKENHLLRVEIDKLKKLNALLNVKKEVEKLKAKIK